MSYVDQLAARSSSANRTTTKDNKCILESTYQYQLATMTALYIANFKLNKDGDSSSAIISFNDLCQLSNGAYTENQFKEMEQTILAALEWNIDNRPTPLNFVQCYLTLVCATHKNINPIIVEGIMSHARYQTEIVVADSSILITGGYRTSEIALAAVINSVLAIDTFLLSLKEQQQLIFDICNDNAAGVSIINNLIIKLQENITYNSTNNNSETIMPKVSS